MRYMMGDSFVDNWHLRVICDKLTEVVYEGSKKLLIQLPPQHAKSTMVSIYLPAFMLAKHPESKNAICSYSASLANGFNRQFQRIILSKEYWDLFPHMIVDDETRKMMRLTTDDFVGPKGGGLVSVGVTGSLTGRPITGIGIIDDLIKDRQDANSVAGKKLRKEFWSDVFTTRLSLTASIIVMMTRWATDDLVGQILKSGGLDKGWEILSFPALGPDPDYPHPLDPRTEENEPLWAEHKGDYETLQRIREEIGSHSFGSLFQQKPKVLGGNIIKEEWIQHYTTLPFDPKSLRPSDLVQSWDLTFKETLKGSYVVGVTLARFEASFYLVDFYRRRADIIETKIAIKRMDSAWPNCHTVLIEEKANGSAILTLLKKEVTGMVSVLPDATKDERLMAVAPIFEAGNFFVNANSIHTKDVVEELTTFPASSHDDIVDAISQGLMRYGKLRGINHLRAAARGIGRR